MAFDNVTFFEVHLDGANIGPAAGSDDTMDEEYTDEEYTEGEMEMEMNAGMDGASAGRRGRGLLVAVAALVAVAGVVAVRRRRGGVVGSDEGIEIESVADGESVEAVER